MSPVQKPREYLQLQQRGNANDILRGRHRSARCGNPNDIGLPLIGWGSDMGGIATSGYDIHIYSPMPVSELFLVVIYNPNKPATKTDFSLVDTAHAWCEGLI